MLVNYKNGNADITLYPDGTRIIEFDGDLNLDMPLNLDIKVSSQCSLGLNPKTGKAFCSFCHESNTTDGKECDYNALQAKLIGLPKGIELAIGCNKLTNGLKRFIVWCDTQGFIVNLTVNQGHVKRDFFGLYELIENGLIKGLGVSYRGGLNFDVPKEILDYENTVFHVIAGIDTFDEVVALRDKGVRKLLVLGEKNFGFNEGNVDLSSRKHREWFWWVHKTFSIFDVVSFDNLALEQLKLKRFFTQENWDVFNQMEHSFYLNAVDQTMSPSSRSPHKTAWEEIGLGDYYKEKIK